MSPSSTMLTTGKRILIFSLSYFPEVGGAEVAIKELTDRIGDTRLNDTVGQVEFEMLTLSMRNGSPRFERVGNVNVYRLGGGLGYLSKIIFVPRAFIAARKLHRLRHYSTYWLMMTYMLFPVVLLRLCGDRTPYILTLQDGDPFSRVFGRWFILPLKPLLLYGFRHAAKIQAISNYLAKWAQRIGYQGNTLVIP